MKTKTAWIIVNGKGDIVHYSSADGSDQGYEVHKTAKTAKSFAFRDERIKKAVISWE